MKKKQICSIFLALALVLSLLPVTAMAASNENGDSTGTTTTGTGDGRGHGGEQGGGQVTSEDPPTFGEISNGGGDIDGGDSTGTTTDTSNPDDGGKEPGRGETGGGVTPGKDSGNDVEFGEGSSGGGVTSSGDSTWTTTGGGHGGSIGNPLDISTKPTEKTDDTTEKSDDTTEKTDETTEKSDETTEKSDETDETTDTSGNEEQSGDAPASPTQGVTKPRKGAVKWIERVPLPGWVKTFYNVLSGDSLSDERSFTLSAGGPDVQGQEIVEVECVDFALAEMYAAEGLSLDGAIFGAEDFYQVSADGAGQVNYAALAPGDVVRTSAFNGVYVTSIPRDAGYDEAKKATASYISTVFQAFDRDHPEIFWLSGKCKMRTITVKSGDAQTAYFFLVLADDKDFDMRSPDWTKPGAVAGGIQRMETAVEEILDTVTADTADGQARQLNRWLTEHNQYNTTPDLTTIGNEPHEALSALEGRIDRDGPVCDGYSRAFKVLCDRLEIPCVLENGYAKTGADSKGEFHMWNAVEIGGQWYGVDVTWDDPSVKGFVGAKSGKENEQFLLVGADTVVRKMTFADSHPATNRAAADGVAFSNGPSLNSVAFSALTANAGLSALPFTDVAEGAWYYDNVSYVYQQGIMLGATGDKFSPGSNVTRQQLWMILARMDGADPETMDAARAWATGAGISDGSNPKGQLTREQLVTMLYRYCEEKGQDMSASASLSAFTDAGSVSNYAVDALRWAVGSSIIAGIDGAVVPQGSATRAQMAAILQRVCAKQ